MHPHWSSWPRQALRTIGQLSLGLLLFALFTTASPARAVGIDLSVSGFTCDLPTQLGYLPGTPIQTTCTVPITVSGALLLSPTARIKVEALTVAVNTTTGFVTLTKHGSRVVDSFPFSGTTTAERTVTLNGVDVVTDEPLDPWLAEQYSLGRKLRLAVVLDESELILDLDRTNNSASMAVVSKGFFLTPLTGALHFGPVATTLTSAKVKRLSTGCCTPGDLELHLGANISWSPGGNFVPQTLTTVVSLVVEQHSSTVAGLALAAITGVEFPAVAGTFAGLRGEVDVKLDERGITVGGMRLTLPTGHSYHTANALGRPVPRGSSTIDLTTTSIRRASDLTTVRGELTTGFLHANALPFHLVITRLVVAPRSVALTSSATHYVHDVGYLPSDPRFSVTGLPRITSNDLRYGRTPASPTTRTLRLDRFGLSGTVDLGPGAGEAHFPRIHMAWPRFSLIINRGAIKARQLVPADLLLRFRQSPDCPGCPTSVAGNLVQATPPGRISLGADGAVIASLSDLPPPSWGPATATGRAFERDGEAGRGRLFIPGFTMPGTATLALGTLPPALPKDQPTPSLYGQTVPESLLGARAAVSDRGILKPTDHYSLTDDETRRGNHLFAGITVGPELYSQRTTGSPLVGNGHNLAGSTTAIHFGGPEADGGCEGPCPLTANVGTRYVVRPAGVTGCFNSLTPPSPEIYGFPIPFSRFGFRQVLNAIDPYSWNDGTISVINPGGFDVAFKSMALECTGAVGDALVIPANPDDPTAPNSDEVLHAWQAAFIPLSLSFDGALTDDVCLPGDRDLEIGAEVDLAALDVPIGLTATWNPDGTPRDERVTGDSDNVLERAADATNRGVPVALHRTVLLEHDGDSNGVFVFNMDFGLRLFDLVNADVRLKNLTRTTGAPTIVRAGDGSGAPVATRDWLAENTPCNGDNTGGCAPEARYTWGSSGFAMNLPVWFDTSDTNGRGLQFSGVTVERNLAVMSLDAGVDYATADETRITFGASANFADLALSEIVLDIDLGDAAALIGVDALLATLGVPLVDGLGPIGAIVEGVRAKTDAMLDLVGDASSGALRLVVDAAIEAVVEATFPRIFDDVVEIVLAVRGLTAHLASGVTVAFDELLVSLLAPWSASLDAEVVALYELLVTLITSIDVVPCDAAGLEGECQEALRVVETLIYALELAKSLLTDTTAVATGTIESVRETVDGIVHEARADVATALALAMSLRNELKVGLADFETPELGVNPLYAFFAVTLVPGVGDVLDELESLDFQDNIERLETLLDTLPGPSLSAEIESDLIGRAGDLISEYQVLIPSFHLALEDLDLAVTLDGALDLLIDIETQLAEIDTQLVDVEATIDGPLVTLAAAVDTRIDGLDKLIDMAERIRETILCAQSADCIESPFKGMLEAELEATLDQAVSVATDGVYGDFIIDGAPDKSFVLDLPDHLREPFDEAVATLTLDLGSLIPALDELPVFTSGIDLRLTLVDHIMSSGPIENMLLAFESHFDLLVEDVTLLVDDLFAQVENILADLAKALNDAAASALAKASSVIDALSPDLPIDAFELDGYALIAGDELERLHVGASFTMNGNQDDDTRTFEAALDVTNWSTNGKADACDPGVDPSSLLDAIISTQNLPLKIGTGEVTIENLSLGFTLSSDGGPPTVVGLFGGITTDGSIDFSDFKIYDIGFAAGAGLLETYVGATATAAFSSMTLSVAFLAGRTCDPGVLAALDPQAAEFITLPGGLFNGVYVRGSASMPIVDLGCLLNLSLTADVGTWLLGGPPLTLGGLVGGGAFGKFGCIGALRGQATAFAELSGDTVKFKGEGFAVAGLGTSCDPETWTTIPKSRDDKNCGTGDASVSLTYKNGGWTVPKPKVSAVH